MARAKPPGMTLRIARKTRFVLALSGLVGCGSEIIEAPGDEIGGSAESSENTAGTDSETGSSSTSETSSSESDTTTASDTTTDTASDTTTSDTTSDTTEGPSDCFSNADCEQGNCLEGDCVVVSSCKALAELDTNSSLADGVYQLDPDLGGPKLAYAAYCDMTTDGGGWTLVLKSDGNLDTFRYAAAEWASVDPFQPEFPDLDRREAKLSSYASVGFDELRIGMEYPPGIALEPLVLAWIDVPLAGDSLHALISPGMLVPTNVGRDTWKSLIAGASLQLNCNLEGLNVAPSGNTMDHRIRIGILGNDQNECNSPNSRIGIGGDGNKCSALPNATGNFAGCQADNGDVNSIGFGVVLVR